MDATQIAARVRDGRLSPRAVVDECLAHIASFDPAIGAFQVVDVHHSNHYVFLQHPREVAEVMRKFLGFQSPSQRPDER